MQLVNEYLDATRGGTPKRAPKSTNDCALTRYSVVGRTRHRIPSNVGVTGGAVAGSDASLERAPTVTIRGRGKRYRTRRGNTPNYKGMML